MKSIANILSRKPEKTEEKEQEAFKEERYDQRQGLIALYNKEMTDHFRSKRILIVLALIGLTSFASLYGALSVFGVFLGDIVVSLVDPRIKLVASND